MNRRQIFEHVIDAVQCSSGIKDLKRVTRKREYVDARRIAYYILRNVHALPLQVIADEFNKNHASVIHGIKDIDFLMKSDSWFKEVYTNSVKRIAQGNLRKIQILEEIEQLQKEFLTLI